MYNKGVDVLKTNKSKALEYFDEATPYLLQVEKLSAAKTNLTLDEKADLKETYDLPITIYEQKNMTEKATEYTKKFNALNKYPIDRNSEYKLAFHTILRRILPF